MQPIWGAIFEQGLYSSGGYTRAFTVANYYNYIHKFKISDSTTLEIFLQVFFGLLKIRGSKNLCQAKTCTGNLFHRIGPLSFYTINAAMRKEKMLQACAVQVHNPRLTLIDSPVNNQLFSK